MEPDEQDERLHRAMEDRYASIRPDLDGMSFLSALMSSVDAAAVDRILTALAAAAEPGDLRTMAQRRSDALVDMLCGRISNGCHVRWNANDDSDDHVDDPIDDDQAPAADRRADDGAADDLGSRPAGRGGEERHDSVAAGTADQRAEQSAQDEDWRTSDWEQPASVFRPDRRSEPVPPPEDPPLPPDTLGRTGNGTWRVTPCPGEHQVNPAPVTIGVVVSIQSFYGFSTMPGQLTDRSALVPADQIRELARRKGTLFYRLLTDEHGHLLDVTEMGRFPSRKLGMAIKFRDGTCTGPTCHKTAADCDMDHVIPHPEGPTTAMNLNNDCRPEHRAKTFAGHVTTRTGPHTSTWTTPNGAYLSQ